MSDSLVIIPTYNERENIERILRAVLSQPLAPHVLVVDDNSPDGTAAIVKQMQAEFSGVLHISEREGKLGLGTAYIHGFQWGLQRDYEFLFEMDADFSHRPEDLNRLRQVLLDGNAHIAIGSRYVKGGQLVNWPRLRYYMSFGASLYVRAITWLPVKDATAGFLCYRRAVLESIRLDDIRFVGYAFQIEMKYAAWKLGFRLVEIPITFVEREVGVSKMSIKIFREAMWGVLVMRWKSWFGHYRRR